MKLKAIQILAAAALAACGGGGGGGTAAPTPTAPASTNVEAAVRALVRNTHSYSLHGSASTGASLTGTMSTAPAGTLSYQGLNFDSSALTLSVSSGSTLLSAQTLVLWYYTGTVNLRFSTNSGSNSCDFYTANTALPTSASLGTSGAYFTATHYPGCTSPATAGPFSSGTVTGTWSFGLVDGAPLVCVNSSSTTAGLTSTETSSICAEVLDANGTLGTRARYTSKDANNATITLGT